MQNRREPEHRRRKQLLFNRFGAARSGVRFGGRPEGGRPPTGGYSAAIRVVDGATSVLWVTHGDCAGATEAGHVLRAAVAPSVGHFKGACVRSVDGCADLGCLATCQLAVVEGLLGWSWLGVL
jgi:hypothetical protein